MYPMTFQVPKIELKIFFSNFLLDQLQHYNIINMNHTFSFYWHDILIENIPTREMIQ